MSIVSPRAEVEHAAACKFLDQTFNNPELSPARTALESVRSDALTVFTVAAVAERGLADAATEAKGLAKLTDAARQARASN